MLREIWTILEILRWTTTYFKSHHIEQSRAAAEMLLAHALGVERIDLYIQYERSLTAEELERFKRFIQRRIRREPVAYIIGRKEFWSMDLKVTPDVLIPRPETESLVEVVLKTVRTAPKQAPLRVLDLGTGSGAIVLAIASEWPGQNFYAVDRSGKALAVAQDNARAHALDKAITFLQGDWFGPVHDLGGCFDVIVSNPPYISSHEFEALPPEIARHEPRDALLGGSDGLDAIRLIIRQAPEHLVPGGWLFFEIGHDQWAAVDLLISETKLYSDWAVTKDYGGHNRVVRAKALLPSN